MINVKAEKKSLKIHLRRFLLSFGTSLLVAFMLFSVRAQASVNIALTSGEAEGSTLGTLQLMFLLALLALAPSILIMMTSFTRIIIVLSFLRQAMGTQQSPSNQILIGLALFLTLFIMQPTISNINDKAFTPYKEGRMEQDEALEVATGELKGFMLQQTYSKDLDMFINMSKNTTDAGIASSADVEELKKLSLTTVIPSFITSELKKAFSMGFLLYIPFLVIDIVVSSTLMSMGMVMLPPAMIAMPFKLMMFILVDGWGMLLGTLSRSFE